MGFKHPVNRVARSYQGGLDQRETICLDPPYLSVASRGRVNRRKLQRYGHVSRSSGLAKTILQGTTERGKRTRQTEEEVGRRHQGMDRPGVRQFPEGSGEQRKMEETGCEVICGALKTLAT